MKEPAMVKLATQDAKEWLQMPQTQATPAPAPAPANTAQAQQTAQPAPPGETPEQKRIRLQKAAQQNIDKTATPVPTTSAAPTPSDIRQAKQAQAGQVAQAQMAPFSKLPDNQAATQAANIRKARQALAAKNAQAQMAVKENATVAAPGTYNKKTGAAKLGGKTMTALSDLPANVQQQIQAKQQAPATPTKSAGKSMPLTPFQVPGAGTNPTPAAAVGNKTVATPQTAAAPTSAYLKDFLAFANQKIAMRDSATYKMIGLADVEKSKLKSELDAAKQAVVAAQGNPAATEAAVKNYILTAMAGAQLIASENAVAAATPQAPAYGQQTATPGAQAGTAATPTVAAGQLTGSNAVALLNKAGLGANVLKPAGQAIQTVTNNKQLSTTGDSVIDTMLEGMGYSIS
jgi:hypothetical protein